MGGRAIMVSITKESINILIDTLAKTSADQNPSGKLTEILKVLLNTEDVKTIRSTILLWLDTMNVLTYNRQDHRFWLNKPTWFPCAENGKHILMGALTKENITSLDNIGVKKNQRNTILYNNYQFELPDTYYTYDIGEVAELEFQVREFPLFFDASQFPSITDATKNLISNKLEINKSDDGLTRVSFIKDDKFSSEHILAQDNVQIFDWVNRNFIRTSIIKEIEDPMGIKLIKVSKKRGGIENYYFENFTLLLEREDANWNYTYFDTSLIDERWARVIYLGKLQYYDLHSELKNRDTEAWGHLFQNISRSITNLKDGAKELHLEISNQLHQSNEILRIPKNMLHQFIRYDKNNQLLAVPISLPLPQRFLKTLYSCSGLKPYLYENKFRINPKYILKLLFNGSLADGCHEIDYPNELFYTKEMLHLYRCVPHSVASIVFERLEIPFCYETFLQQTN